jgi:hypothetical protein
MKSISAKQAPHRSPWPPIRARQEMQTGGRNRLASADRMARAGTIVPALAARATPRESSASPIDMDPMIEGRRGAGEDGRWAPP